MFPFYKKRIINSKKMNESFIKHSRNKENKIKKMKKIGRKQKKRDGFGENQRLSLFYEDRF